MQQWKVVLQKLSRKRGLPACSIWRYFQGASNCQITCSRSTIAPAGSNALEVAVGGKALCKLGAAAGGAAIDHLCHARKVGAERRAARPHAERHRAQGRLRRRRRRSRLGAHLIRHLQTRNPKERCKKAKLGSTSCATLLRACASYKPTHNEEMRVREAKNSCSSRQYTHQPHLLQSDLHVSPRSLGVRLASARPLGRRQPRQRRVVLSTFRDKKI
eukprot:2757775-Pleurochrysis_carterae.AAC.1